MVDSSVDVCDLMIELLCEGCPDSSDCLHREEDGSDVWSHSKLMDCIRQHVKVRAWLAWTDKDIIATFEDLDNSGVLEDKIPEGYNVKEHIQEIIAELPIDSMTTSINERLWDEVLIYMESGLAHE